MGIHTPQVQQLYIAYFKRPADAEGLAVWEATVAEHGVEAVLPSFAGSPEYQELYEGLSTEQVVQALYQNLFGRDGEPAGIAYWLGLLDAGTLSPGNLPLAMANSAAAADADALAAKTAAATAFTEALDTAAKVDGYSGMAANDIARAWLATITNEPASATAAAAAMSSVLANAVDAGNGITHGTLVDGYIVGATVFADANGNGSWDEGEARGVTDANGGFTLTNPQGTLIATGGTDIGTKLPFTGVMIAPEGATIINPITTLQQTLIQQGQSTDQAQATISEAFGLSVANVDFDQRDPLMAAFQAGASAAELGLAVKMHAAAAKTQNLIVATSEALTGAVAGLSDTAASTAAAHALAEVMRTDADGVLSLADASVVANVLTGAAAQAGASAQQIAAIAAITTGFGAILADTARSIDAIVADTGMSAGLAQARILQVQTAVQGTVADTIHAAATAGNIDQAALQLTGAALTGVILETKIGDVLPDGATDSDEIDIVNGVPEPEPEGPDTTAPAAPSGLRLAAADDTGSSNSDGITMNTSGLSITGRAESGSTVDLYSDDGEGNLTLIGSGIASNGRFSIDIALEADEDAYELVAIATDASKNASELSGTLEVTVDTEGPSGLRVGSLINYGASYLNSTYGSLVAAGNSLVQVGGTNDFGTELTDLIDDDASVVIDVSAAFADGLAFANSKFSAIDGLFVGTNGVISFGQGVDSFDWDGVAEFEDSPMIAALFDDLDITMGIGQSPGGTSAGSNHIYYDVDAINRIVTVTWDDVAPFEPSAPDIPGNDYSQGNAFQIRLHHLQGTDFVIEMRYESMNWIAGAGELPTAGWTAGDDLTYNEVQGSGTEAMLDLENTSNFGHNGVFLWEVKGGVVTDYQLEINDAPGKIVFELEGTDDTDDDDLLTYALGNGADARFTLVNGNQIRVAANAQFDIATEPTITLPIVVTDVAGNTLEHDLVVSLLDATTDNIAPTLGLSSPADDAVGVAVDSNIVLTFNEAVRAGSGNIKLVRDDAEGATIDIAVNSSQVVFHNNTVTINPSADLAAGGNYHIEIASGVIEDLADNAFAGITGATALNFSTPVPDLTAPTLQGSTPADNANFVAPDTNLVLTFDEAVKAGSGNIELWQDTGEGVVLRSTIAVTDTSQVTFNGAVMTIDPASDFAPPIGTEPEYYVIIDAGAIVDTVGNQYAGISDPEALSFFVGVLD